MGVKVAFSYGDWIAIWPEFSTVNSAQATQFFGIATTLHANDGTGPIMDPVQQTALLNMLTAHIAALWSTNGKPSATNTPPGRISSASEGSVSVNYEYATTPINATAAFFLQTKYGALYWAATSPYRQMNYVSTPATPSTFPAWLYPQDAGYNF